MIGPTESALRPPTASASDRARRRRDGCSLLVPAVHRYHLHPAAKTARRHVPVGFLAHVRHKGGCKFEESVRTISLDVTNEAQAKYAVDAAIHIFGGLDVLVNNASYGNVCPVEDTSLADFRAQIETNLFGVIIMTKAVLPHFRERASGHIFQISSIGGRVGPTGRAAYAAAKFGVEGFSESLSKEVGPLGIKVTIIEPGGFRTDFAGSSTELREGRPEYDATVGATVRFQRDYDGKQPGDPVKAATASAYRIALRTAAAALAWK
jgi:NAD(P)-dependent dehydrogenase (short-subunit alcohol dehydrogenase family)